MHSVLNIMSSQPLSRKARAFTLIEVMFAVVALSFGLTVILRSFTISLHGVQRLENSMVVAQLLEERMEEVKRDTRENGGIELSASSGIFVTDAMHSEVKWDMAVFSSPWGEDLNEVSITAHWSEGNKDRSLGLKTYLKNKGASDG